MKKKIAWFIIAVLFFTTIFCNTKTFAETKVADTDSTDQKTTDIAAVSVKDSQKVKEFDGGALYKARVDGKMVDIIVYDDGTKEVYSKNKHGKFLIKEKISKDLKAKLAQTAEEYLTVGVWFADIDYSMIDKKAKEKVKISSVEELKENNVQKFIDAKRELARAEYQVKNKKYIMKYMPKESIVFVSDYAPYVIAKVPAKNIEKLAKNADVTAMDMFYDLPKEEETAYSIPNINADYNRDVLNLKGLDVKVGIVEMNYADKSNAQLSGRNITFDVPDAQAAADVGAHATKVTGIIAGNTQGIAPDATVYLAVAKTRAQDYAKIEWLINQGVNVINYSAGYSASAGLYTDMTKWIDHLAFQFDVMFVKSAGNGGPTTGITEPGMAYNGLTIGSIYDGDSASEPNWTDDSFSSFSAYLETEGGFKPDLTAPGQGIAVAGYADSNGTSYSAPHVTAVIAQILGYQPTLKIKPCALNALLKSGTSHKTADDYGNYTNCSDYSNKEGAGVIDAKGAYLAASANNYLQSNVNNSAFPYNKQISIGSTSKPVRVALTWLKQNELVNGAIVERDLSDLDLYVYKPDGTLADYSCSANNNTEFVEFMPTTAGNYTIVVDGYLLENSYETVGLSWYQ
jgi:serine protease AprX